MADKPTQSPAGGQKVPPPPPPQPDPRLITYIERTQGPKPTHRRSK